MDKVGKEGVITVEDGKSLDRRARSRRRHAVRPRLPVALLHQQPRQADHGAGKSLRAAARQEDLQHPRPAAGTRRGGQGRHAAADHRRRRRRRSARHPGGEQPARHPQDLRGEGAGLRRPPQGHAGRHRHPHRRHGDRRGTRPDAGEDHAEGPGPGEAHRDRQGRNHHHRRRRRAPRRSRRGSRTSAPRSTKPPATTTRKSCRNAWPSSPAAWR